MTSMGDMTISDTLHVRLIITVESEKMTKDLAVCIHGPKVEHGKHYLYTEEFLDEIAKNFN